MRSKCVSALVLFLVAVPASAAEKRFGLDRRLPWNDSRVVGSPDPLPPYKVARAFPNLTIKQPLSLTPEPGTNRLFILQHLNVWAGPGRLLAVDDIKAQAVPTTCSTSTGSPSVSRFIPITSTTAIFMLV